MKTTIVKSNGVELLMSIFIIITMLGSCLNNPATVNSTNTVNPGNSITWEKSDTLDVNTLLSWHRYGHGYIGGFRNTAVQLTESENSEGLMILSPETYGTEIMVSYEVMTLRPATVLVLMLSMSEGAGSGKVTVPVDYDGSAMTWPKTAEDYFFAFHNAPHFRHPFVSRRTGGGIKLLQEAGENYMNTGIWHKVEAGRIGGRLWLSIDDKVILDVEDADPLGFGQVSFRIRGSGTETASCFIKSVVIKYNS